MPYGCCLLRRSKETDRRTGAVAEGSWRRDWGLHGPRPGRGRQGPLGLLEGAGQPTWTWDLLSRAPGFVALCQVTLCPVHLRPPRLPAVPSLNAAKNAVLELDMSGGLSCLMSAMGPRPRRGVVGTPRPA